MGWKLALMCFAHFGCQEHIFAWRCSAIASSSGIKVIETGSVQATFILQAKLCWKRLLAEGMWPVSVIQEPNWAILSLIGLNIMSWLNVRLLSMSCTKQSEMHVENQWQSTINDLNAAFRRIRLSGPGFQTIPMSMLSLCLARTIWWWTSAPAGTTFDKIVHIIK